MADIEVVIKIPEEVYKDIMIHNRELRESGKSYYYFEGVIKNGTPLPKGHGDLKDMGNLQYVFDLTREDPIYSGKDIVRAIAIIVWLKDGTKVIYIAESKVE